MWLWFIFFSLMKIISWNVNSVRARIINIQEYIKQYKPDIMLLQEIKTQEENFPYDDFKKSVTNVMFMVKRVTME